MSEPISDDELALWRVNSTDDRWSLNATHTRRLLDEVERLRAELDRYSSPSAKRIVNKMEAIAADAKAQLAKAAAALETCAIGFCDCSWNVTSKDHDEDCGATFIRQTLKEIGK